jgi:hypothetical protein
MMRKYLKALNDDSLFGKAFTVWVFFGTLCGIKLYLMEIVSTNPNLFMVIMNGAGVLLWTMSFWITFVSIPKSRMTTHQLLEELAEFEQARRDHIRRLWGNE